MKVVIHRESSTPEFELYFTRAAVKWLFAADSPLLALERFNPSIERDVAELDARRKDDRYYVLGNIAYSLPDTRSLGLRAHSHLVTCVQTIGNAAIAHRGKLEIVEAPHDSPIQIAGDGCGMEWVEEIHRTYPPRISGLTFVVDSTGDCVAVTITDDAHRVQSIVWERDMWTTPRSQDFSAVKYSTRSGSKTTTETFPLRKHHPALLKWLKDGMPAESSLVSPGELAFVIEGAEDADGVTFAALKTGFFTEEGYFTIDDEEATGVYNFWLITDRGKHWRPAAELGTD